MKITIRLISKKHYGIYKQFEKYYKFAKKCNFNLFKKLDYNI